MKSFNVLVSDYQYIVREYNISITAENEEEAKKIAKELWEQDPADDKFFYREEYNLEHEYLCKTCFSLE